LLSWFRRRRSRDEQAPPEAAAPTPERAPEPPAEGDDPDTTETTDPAGAAGPARPKRRRGTRGGRGRKKPGSAGPGTETATDDEQTDRTGKADRPARKPSDRDRKSGGSRRSSSGRRRTPQKRAPLPAAKRELLVSVDVSEQRVAVLEDGRVAEVYLERPERRSIAGNIYLGVVDNVLPGMEAAFVEIGLEKNGFLYVDEIVVPELEGKRHGKKIQDLIARGEKILVQAVKDPMKTKGARLTTEISLPGRFLVYVPQGEGLGVSRRLPDEERARLKEIIKALEVEKGGVIVRTAAEGASAEDIERDLVFLQRLWKTIEQGAKAAEAPSLVYQESELPLRVIRDLFAGDFERAVVDHDVTHKRIVGYLKKTSPHMVERVERYKGKEPLFEASGVDAEIRSTLSRRVDLPSGGYLIFDYAEAFTVIDVNTGRFVGSRSKSSGARLEDTITKNNLEAVTEVVRQLRLRDIGGIIVIDFIDMANPKNRATVEEALRNELERDRTKTYVVEISPLGLVEMTRQNVTDGPREILTKKCPTCSGDGIVLSEASAAVDAERRLRALVTPGSRTQAYRVELHPKVASLLIGPGAARLKAIEATTRRRFFLVSAAGTHGLDHFEVLAQGKLDDLRPEAPVEEGAELEVKLGEIARHDPAAAMAKLDGIEVCVGDAGSLVGKKAKVRIERVLDGTAYAVRVDGAKKKKASEPITAEREAEKPTRRPPARKSKEQEQPEPEQEAAEVGEAEAAPDDAEAEGAATETPGEAGDKPKKRTRRGSRGGRGRKKKAPAEGAAAQEVEAESGAAPEAAQEAQPAAAEGAGAGAEAERAPDADGRPEAEKPTVPRIHVPEKDIEGADSTAEQQPAEPETPADGAGPAADEAADQAPDANGDRPKKRSRRGSRGGRGRKKKAAVATGAGATGAEAAPEAGAGEGEASAAEAAGESAAEVAEPPQEQPGDGAGRDEDAGEWEYTPMSEWD
jgi:ribonuclease G